MTNPDHYTIQVTLSRRDLLEFSMRTFLRARGVWLVIAAYLVFMYWLTRDAARSFDEVTGSPPAISTALVLTMSLALWGVFMSAVLVLRTFFFIDRLHFEPTVYQFSPEGLTVELESLSNELGWNRVQHVRCTNNHCFLFVTRINAFIVPRACVPQELDWDLFCRFCKEQAERANSGYKS